MGFRTGGNHSQACRHREPRPALGAAAGPPPRPSGVPGPAHVDGAFAELGVDNEGRVRKDLDLLFEAPTSAGLPGETAPRSFRT